MASSEPPSELNIDKSDQKSIHDESKDSQPKTPLSPDQPPNLSQPMSNISVKINTNASTDTQLAKALLQPLNRMEFPNYTNFPDLAKPQLEQNVAINSATMVVVSQPTHETKFVKPPARQWKTDLFNICADTRICCCSFFCFRCFACCVARDLGESDLVPLCVPGWLYVLRTKLRSTENIEGSVISDCCTACWCPSCTLCQIARELQATRGE